MIDPLRPYWPTNRSIAGLLLRAFCVLSAAAVVAWSASRLLAFVVVLGAALVQASLLVYEWMELRRTKTPGFLAGALISVVLICLVMVLVIESRSVLVLSVR